MTTVRDTMRGIKSNPTRLPATVSRTASLAKVAQNIHGKLRYARFTPQGLVGSLILGEILDSLIDEGYVYNEQLGTMVLNAKNELVVRPENQDEFKYVHVGMPDNIFSLPQSQVLKQYVEPYCIVALEKSGIQATYKRVSGQSHIVNSYIGSCYAETASGREIAYAFWGISARIGQVPLTDSEFQRILEPIAAQNPEAVLQAANLSDSDWSAPKVHVLPGTIVNSQPFTDPKDGKAKQARWEFYDCEDGQSCVKETLTDRPDLQPNSPAAPAPDNPPANGSDTAPGEGGQSGSQSGNQTGTDQPPPFDLCREYPDSLACQKMGQPDPGQFDDIRIPVHVDNRTWQEDLFLPSTGVCPAPKTFHVMGKPVSVSYQPLCSFMETIRFIVLICFIVSAAYISFGGLKQG